MSKNTFSDFMSGQQREPKKGMVIDIDASCQVCHAYVGTGEYFAVEKILKWACEDGHTSFIEGFNL